MNIAAWSIRRPVPVLLLFAVLTLAGLWSWRQLHTQYIPDLALPSVQIRLGQPGASPARLEMEVARPVEDAVFALQGVQHVETRITDGEVMIDASFSLDKPAAAALIEVKDAVDRLRGTLPADLDPPAVSTDVAFDDPVLTYAVTSPAMDERELAWFVDDTVARVLRAAKGVGRVERLGGLDREVRVDVDPVQLAAVGLTVPDVAHALRAQQLDVAGGQASVGAQDQTLRVALVARQASDLRALPLPRPDGGALRLDQFARVADAAAPRTRAARLDGHVAVGFHVYRAFGQDELALQADVQRILESLSSAGRPVRFTPVVDKVTYTRAQYRGSMDMLLEGAVLAILVVAWFLRDWRATLVSAAALPLSIIPVFAAMHALGFTLNTLTLLALALVVGILVDDAIVEIENIVRHVHEGKPVREAAVDAVQEIALAVVATTLTLVAVFVPTSMMNSVPGQFFREFGWTAAVAVLCSLLVARLLTPLMAIHLLAAPHAAEPPVSRAMTRYLALVRWCIAHRGATLALALAFFAGSLALVPLLPTGLLPAVDQGHVTVEVELAPGSAIDETLARGEAARGVIGGIEGVQAVLVTAGGSEARRGRLFVALEPAAERRPQAEIEAAITAALAALPGARFRLGGGQDDRDLELILAGNDSQALLRSATQLERELRALPSLTHVKSTASLERPALVIRPDAARAAELGVSSQAIADTLRIATAGDRPAALPKLGLETRELPIVVRVPEAVRQDLDALRALRVPSRHGPLPLSAVASVDLESGPAEIERHDRQRFIQLTASLGSTSLGAAAAQARALPAARQLPDGVVLIDAGNAENMNELLDGFAFAMVAGLLCVYCLLAVLFSSFVLPLTILSALPLSLGGAFVALLATGGQLNIPSLIGLVMLMGLAAKNSILLVEYAEANRHGRGMAPREAIVDACRKRVRPIVMTTLAMSAGMLPIALGVGADAAFRQPMALAVIGGLFTSTALSLLVVPVVYLAVVSGAGWKAGPFAGGESPAPRPGAAPVRGR